MQVPPLFTCPSASLYSFFPGRRMTQPAAIKPPPRAKNHTQPGRARYNIPAPVANKINPRSFRPSIPGRKYNFLPPYRHLVFLLQYILFRAKKIVPQRKESTPQPLSLRGGKAVGQMHCPKSKGKGKYPTACNRKPTTADLSPSGQQWLSRDQGRRRRRNRPQQYRPRRQSLWEPFPDSCPHLRR